MAGGLNVKGQGQGLFLLNTKTSVKYLQAKIVAMPKHNELLTEAWRELFLFPLTL